MNNSSISFNKPFITDDDISYLHQTLNSLYFADGPASARAENIVSKLMGGGYSRSTSSGTASLFLALKALQLPDQSQIAVPSYACSALLDAVYLANFVPLIIDSEQDSPNMNLSNVDCQAAIVVHTYGIPANLLHSAPDTKIIEDCCHSIGGYNQNGEPLGSKGDISIFSFYATKIIAAGSGGLIFSQQKDIVDFINDYLKQTWGHSHTPGFNLRSNDITSSLVIPQLLRIADIRKRRQYIYDRYEDACQSYMIPLFQRQGIDMMPYRFVMLAENADHQDRIEVHFRQKGIETSKLLRPHELLHRKLGLNPDVFPNAERLTQKTIALPLHLHLTDRDIDLICDGIKGI